MVFHNTTFDDYSPKPIRILKSFYLLTETNLFNFPAFHFFNGFSLFLDSEKKLFVAVLIFYYDSELESLRAEAGRAEGEKFRGSEENVNSSIAFDPLASWVGDGIMLICNCSLERVPWNRSVVSKC